MTLPRLLLLTDRSQLRAGHSLVRTVADCVRAGATHLILRELDLGCEHRAALVEALSRVGATVLAAGKTLPGAAGVHLPAGAPCGTMRPPKAASGLPGKPLAGDVVGRSCHSRAEVEAAAADGLTYATLGPFAVTASKPGYGPPLPPEAYAGLPVPTYALGGVDPHNAKEAVEAGAHGVAVMGAVMRAAEPAAVVHELLAAIG